MLQTFAEPTLTLHCSWALIDTEQVDESYGNKTMWQFHLQMQTEICDRAPRFKNVAQCVSESLVFRRGGLKKMSLVNWQSVMEI